MSVCPSVRRSFSDERGPGTFHSLGVLPKRTRDISARKPPVFHIHHDDDDDHSSSLDEQTAQPVSASLATIHFPTSRSPSPGSSSSSTSRPSSPPQLARGASSPIHLSNGKPLKPSLKSSSSSPAMLIPPHMHLRARSEPSTPKNVHFPEKDYGLATVCVYNRSARPAALGSPVNGNGDETETEGEETPPTRFPFPPHSAVFNYEIDPTKSSPVPSRSSTPANLLLESLNTSPSSFSTARPLLTGSVLVRNLAFEKLVVIRFTLDDWQTVSEVGAHYVNSVRSQSPSLPPEDSRGRGWDRFTFTIRLEDYAHSLSTRTLWLAARYRVNSTYPEPGRSQYGPGGEWWDNNGGGNYRIGFRPAIAAPASSRSRPRRETVSAPISSPRTQPPPLTTCREHALGLMVPSVCNNKEVRRPPSLRTGKLNLCNYAPPTCRPTSSMISSPSTGSPNTITNLPPPSATPRSSDDEESASPVSSTLSTPSVSPTIVPRVIIGGQPATPTYNSSERDDDTTITYTKPGLISDRDWSAPSKLQVEEPSCQHVELVPGSEPAERPRDFPLSSARKTLSDTNALYNAFVTQWCFAQGPSPSHHAYDDCRVMT